jgi:hypothetical protein
MQHLHWIHPKVEQNEDQLILGPGQRAFLTAASSALTRLAALVIAPGQFRFIGSAKGRQQSLEACQTQSSQTTQQVWPVHQRFEPDHSFHLFNTLFVSLFYLVFICLLPIESIALAERLGSPLITVDNPQARAAHAESVVIQPLTDLKP